MMLRICAKVSNGAPIIAYRGHSVLTMIASGVTTVVTSGLWLSISCSAIRETALQLIANSNLSNDGATAAPKAMTMQG